MTPVDGSEFFWNSLSFVALIFAIVANFRLKWAEQDLAAAIKEIETINKELQFAKENESLLIKQLAGKENARNEHRS